MPNLAQQAPETDPGVRLFLTKAAANLADRGVTATELPDLGMAFPYPLYLRAEVTSVIRRASQP